MKPVRLDPNHEPVSKSSEVAEIIIAATDAQVAEKGLKDDEKEADFRLSSDALNYHRVAWRLREEGAEPALLLGRLKGRLCEARGYEPEEFDAALVATANRARLPYGWTALDLARQRVELRPLRLLNPELEASRYARGIVGLAFYLQEIQGEEPILLPVDQVREILGAKKVVVAGTIQRLVALGLLEMTKAAYNTGSAREYRFRGVEGKDYVRRQKPLAEPLRLNPNPNTHAGE